MMVGLSTVKRPKAVNPMGALLSWVRKVVIYIGNNTSSHCNICVKDKETFPESILIHLNFNSMLLFLFKVLDV